MTSGEKPVARRRRFRAVAAVGILVVAAAVATVVHVVAGRKSAPRAATPIRHLVVIYLENVSFDHYFGTYPHALNPAGEPPFHAVPGTPQVNGLTAQLLERNPNGANPQRLDRSQPITCDNDHSYRGEQVAFDNGRMDRFLDTGSPRRDGCDPATVMDYYDGNTVTALWNYAQRFAMSDNSRDVTFGPTLPGHLNLVAGTAAGAHVVGGASSRVRNGTVIGNLPARYDACAPGHGPRLVMSGPNIGEQLSAAGVTWGYFSEGFAATSRREDGSPVCGSEHSNVAGHAYVDYISGAITEPFQYWASTANPAHRPPASTAEIGHDGRAHHQYDLNDLWRAAAAGRMPAVSFIKPAAYDNGHAGMSDPLDEQRFLVDTIDRLERLPTWRSTAVIIAYDDSDGWYDHQMTTVRSSSHDPVEDALTGAGACSGGSADAIGEYPDRCGPGPRQPFLVLSPYARRNYVDHTATTQVSITRFIEDNWLHGRRLGGGSFDATAGSLAGFFDFRHPDDTRLLLDPSTGEPLPSLAR